MTGSHEPIPVANEACRSGAESAKECGIVRGQASGYYLTFDGAHLIRTEVKGPVDSGKDVVNVPRYDQIGEGHRRLPRVLGDKDRDSLPWDVRLQDAGRQDGSLRQPHGDLCGFGHGSEIMWGNPDLIAGDLKLQEGAHLAISFVRHERAGIIKTLVIPPGRWNQGNPAFQGQA